MTDWTSRNGTTADWTRATGFSAQGGAPSAHAWDHVLWLSNKSVIELPGVATVGVTSVFNVSVQSSPNSEGASMTPQGRTPKDVDMTFKCWTTGHMTSWELLIPRFMPDAAAIKLMLSNTGSKGGTQSGSKGGTQRGTVSLSMRAFLFVHPIITQHQINQVLVTSLSGPTIDGPGGGFTISMKCKEVLQIKANPHMRPEGHSTDPRFQNPDNATPPSGNVKGKAK